MVQRIGLDGTAAEVTTLPARGSGAYEVEDPFGAPSDQYKLIEHQTGGRGDLSYGIRSVIPPFTPYTGDANNNSAEVDSALASIPGPNPGPDTPAPFPNIPVAVVCADSMQSSAQSFVNLLISREISAGVVRYPTDTATRGGIKPYLAWLHGIATQYAVFWGTASDSVPFVAPWPAGYPKPPWTPKFVPNVLPTNYVSVAADSAYKSTSYVTPYYATDLGYVDFDNDGLPDIAYARVPVKNNAEGYAYIVKDADYRATSPTQPWVHKASVHSYAVDFGMVPGTVIAAGMPPDSLDT
jgi:hypothetical protein